MPDYTGLGAFGAGALQGYDQSLSRYATLDQMIRQHEAEKRAAQAQALQSLVHGNQLAQTSPDVAEMAAREPDRYGLSPETVGPGVAQARKDMADSARLNQALTNGDLDALNDPSVARMIRKEHLKTINELYLRKKVDAIIADPNLNATEKAQAMLRIGAKPPEGLLNAAYPELGGAQAEARTGGEMRGKLPYAGVLAEAEAIGKGKGELVTAGPLTRAKKEAELGAELSPEPQPEVPLNTTAAGRLAREKETPAQRERRLRPPAGASQLGPKDISVALKRVGDSARNDVNTQLKTVRKGQWAEFTPEEQRQIHEYLVNQRTIAIAQSDPVLADQQIQELPRPAVMDKFEKSGQDSGWDITGWLFGGKSEPTKPITPPAQPQMRQIRPNQPTPAAGGWGRATVVR